MSSEKESNGSDGKAAASSDNGSSAADISAVVSEQEKQLAISAAADFRAGKYAACVESLEKLYALRPTDGKVAHNRAVARAFVAKSPKGTEEFIRELLEASTQLHANFASPDALDDIDQCTPFLNYAVALFHTQQYRQALAVLDRLFQFIEPMDEAAAKRMCFLHIELCLCLHQPEKALVIVAYLENLLFGSKSASSTASGESAPGVAGGPSPSTTPQKSPDREPAESSGAEAERSRLQFYKTRCLIMMRSVKASKREMKNLVSSSLGSSNQTVFLRGQLEFIRGNYRKAVKILCTAQIDRDARTTAMYHNNMGCVHFSTGKPHLGSFHFVKALNTYPHTSHDDAKRNLPDGRVYFEILGNLGLQNLYAGKYTSAFDSLVEAVRMQPTNARLWLRIAECCVNRHKSDNSTDFQLKDRKRLMIEGTAGAGAHRKIILSHGISSNKYTPQESDSSAAMPAPTLEFAALCLRNALKLLLDTPATSVASAGDATSGSAPDDTPATPADAAAGATLLTSVVDDTSIAAVRNSALGLASFVALCLGDTLVALKHAETLLAQPRISSVHNFLGHMYAAEALLLLDRVGDAIEHLNPELVRDLSYGFPEPEDSAASKAKEETKTPSFEESGKTYRKPWFPATPSMAKVVSLYNLAVAYTLRGGGLGKATETLRLLSVPKGPDPEIPVQALMLAIYVQLQQGHADLAKNIIKQHLPQYK